MASQALIQGFIQGLCLLLGALIAGMTSSSVTNKTLSHNSKMERLRGRLSKGEELISVLSNSSAWRPRNDQEVLTELVDLEARNISYALAVAYFGEVEDVVASLHNYGRAVLEKLNDYAQDYVGCSPGADLDVIKVNIQI